MKIWVDDKRHPPDGKWVWFKNSSSALAAMKNYRSLGMKMESVSLDHDLGGDDTTRPIVMWWCQANYWPDVVFVHSMNPIGREWLEGMISRYHPEGTHNPERYENGSLL